MSICVVNRCTAEADSILVVSAIEEPTRTAAICGRHRRSISRGESWAWEPTSPGCGRVLLGVTGRIGSPEPAQEIAARSA
jgi:hypothetical protein